jgi:hypothetical protein
VGAALTDARLEWISGRATEAWYFSNACNAASIRLHARFAFREVTREFTLPGVTFEGGEGILFRAGLAHPRGSDPVRLPPAAADSTIVT